MAITLSNYPSGSNYLSRTTKILNDNSPYTTAFWLKLNNNMGAYSHFWAIMDVDYTKADWVGTDADGLTLRLVARNGNSGQSSVVTGSALSVGVWTHLAVVRESVSVLKLYVNGKLDATATYDITGRVAATSERIGAHSNGFYMDGSVQAFKQWSVALNEEELKTEMDSISPFKNFKIHAWYPFLNSVLDSYIAPANYTINGSISIGENKPLAWSFNLQNAFVPLLVSSTTNSLTATDITTASPTLENGTLHQVHLLVASGLTTGNPSNESVAIHQIHALLATSPTTGPPTLEAPVIGLIFNIAANNITSGFPAVDSAAINQIHVLGAQSLTSGTPSVENVIASITSNLTANNITTGQPTLQSPSMSGEVQLTANGIVCGQPNIEAATISQVHVLVSSGIASGSPTLEQPTLSVSGWLSAIPILTGQPDVGQPALNQTHTLLPTGITSGAPIVDSATISSVVALNANAIVVGQPVVQNAALFQIHGLLATSIVAGNPSVEQNTLYQLHILTASILLTGIPTVGIAYLDFAQRPITRRTKVVQALPKIKYIDGILRRKIEG